MGRLVAAVGVVLARDGARGVGVNAVAREAGLDKVLIYRYFGGLHELVSAYALSGAFWPEVDELVAAGGGDGGEATAAQVLARWLRGFAGALRARPQTLEIMAWELVERSEITDILDDRRQRTARELLDRAARATVGGVRPGAVRLDTVLAVLTSAVSHLALAARRRGSVGGLDLNGDAGWDAVLDTVEHMLLRICN